MPSDVSGLSAYTPMHTFPQTPQRTQHIHTQVIDPRGDIGYRFMEANPLVLSSAAMKIQHK